MMLLKKGKYPNLERAGFLVPIKVSMNGKDMLQAHGTKAYVPLGTEIPKCARYEKRKHLRALANQAPFFSKMFSERQQHIAEKLKAAGIETERFVLATNNGRAIFEKSGQALNSDEGKRLFHKNFWDNTEKLEEMVARMHSNGITHNHLHPGNITIDKEGKIRIIDLGKATMVNLRKLKEQPKGWALRKFFPDLANVSGLLWLLSVGQFVSEGFREEVIPNIIGYYSQELCDKINSDDMDLMMVGYSAVKRYMEMGNWLLLKK